MVQLSQPDQFFPWLAKFVGVSGPFSCSGVRFDRTGALTFSLMRGEDRVQVTWTVATSAPTSGDARETTRPFRDGALSAPASPAGQVARDQAERQLSALLSRGTAPLLTTRSLDEATLRFGSDLLDQHFSGVLHVGDTVVAGLLLARATMSKDDALVLLFEGKGQALTVHLEAAGMGAPDEGPLSLVVPSGQDLTAEGEAVVAFVGYALALRTHRSMTLHRQRGRDRGDSKRPLGDKTNPFLQADMSAGGIVMSAFFACRGRASVVLHADRECTGFASYLTGLTETVYLHQVGLRPSIDYLRRLRIVDTSEIDAIMTGCQDKLTALIDGTVREEDPDLLLVMGTCVSRVIGDDVATAVSESGAEERGTPVVWLETTATDADQHHRILWQRLVELFDRPERDVGEDGRDEIPSVNLLGYGFWRTAAIDELSVLLASIGVERGACLVPSFDVDELKRFGAANRNVVLHSALNQDSLSWALPKLRAPVLSPPAPYGFSGTRGWLEAINSSFGHDPLGDHWVEERHGPLLRRWRELQTRASAHRAGIVLTADHYTSDEPLLRAGLPWFYVLQEMGFGLDVFVVPVSDRPGDPIDVTAAVDETTALLRPGGSVTAVETRDDLLDVVEGGRFELFYTEIPTDRYATGLGKVPINHTDFEMGFAGACRTLDRLLVMAQTPFFERYHHYLHVPGSSS